MPISIGLSFILSCRAAIRRQDQPPRSAGLLHELLHGSTGVLGRLHGASLVDLARRVVQPRRLKSLVLDDPLLWESSGRPSATARFAREQLCPPGNRPPTGLCLELDLRALAALGVHEPRARVPGSVSPRRR